MSSGLESFEAAKDWALIALMGGVAYFVRGVHTEMKKISASQAAQTTIQAVQDTRLASAEREIAQLRLWREDISNFFQSMGFKKRDG